MIKGSSRGQSAAEYALLIGMVVLVIVASIIIIGRGLTNYFHEVRTHDVQTPTPQTLRVFKIKADLLQKMQQYYAQNDAWPGEGNTAFSKLGLNPVDWLAPVDGIVWLVQNDGLRLVNAEGDQIQVYVSNLKGKEFHLFDGWTIWCPAQEDHCWYQSTETGFEVNMDTLRVVDEVQ
jgi:Flp pilus assembly pilin Flp